MGLTKHQRNIKRLCALVAETRDASKEIDSLKEYFREQAEGKDTTFACGEDEVVVTGKERESYDTKKLVAAFGQKAAQYRKVTPYVEVSCRKKSAKDAA